MSVDELVSLEKGGAEALRRLRLGYTESQGSPTLRQEVSKLYTSIDASRVLIHAGAEEATYVFAHAVLASGADVVVQQPCYQSLSEIARSLGCRVIPWRMRSDSAWYLDPDELAQLVTPTTRAIIINTPHNPTGHQVTAEVLRETARFAATRGITLFCDEVYRGLEYNEADRLPAACDLSETAISLGVMSKTYGLPGLRIGWVATRDEHLLSRMAEVKDYTSICAAGPSEALAEIALRHGEQIALRNRRIIADNLAVLDRFFALFTDLFRWDRPLAGPIAFPRLLEGNVEEFCGSLVRDTGVLLLPGSVYADTTNRFRIGFGRKDMPEAVRHLTDYLRHGVRDWSLRR
jgi:aspartate/methionine/tyrosine aminotransferase